VRASSTQRQISRLNKDKGDILTNRQSPQRKTQFISDLKTGVSVNDLFAVCEKRAPRPYSDKPGLYFGLLVCDKTGSIPVRFWGREDQSATMNVFDSFLEGDVIEVRRGIVKKYQDQIQISIQQDEGELVRSDNFDGRDFIGSLETQKIEFLFSRLKEEIATIEDQQLRKLVQTVFEDQRFVSAYKQCPSSRTHHHNYLGGNLQHTIHVVSLCRAICEDYPGIRKDLLVSAAILHDVGKTQQYRCGAAITLTREGALLGHAILGHTLIKDTIEKLRARGQDFSKDLEDELGHLILSHHGRNEWGSPVEPRTVEASVLHYADLMDSRVKNFMQREVRTPSS